MEKAKAAVSDFMSKAGHHDTTVHENVAPAVQHQTVKPEKHEKVTTAVDKEIHQDHYHTSVQPVHDREVLPEKHHHNLVGVEHRQFEHGNDHDVKTRLEQEAAQFKDKTETSATQTIEPHVVHTTVPIHEVHHNAAQHHSSSALPAVSMADFKKQGGVLTGREERYDGFEGEPRNIGGTSSAGGALRGDHSIAGDRGSGLTGTGSHSHTHHTGGHGVGSGITGNTAGSRTTGEAIGTGLASGTGSHAHGEHTHGTSGTHFDRANEGSTTGGNGLTGSNTRHAGEHGVGSGLAGSHGAGNKAGVAGIASGTGATGAAGSHSSGQHGSGAYDDSTTTQKSKPSLLQKLNPLADADGDGKKGFMD
ncbi:hypothetical protein UCRNP2_7918 [Neofusicoccum parvum UCRNP2]|uniref:Allergen protein n=1 Tax=Botryosphaeria parva (strain UCR-NP2) TaxID=1287680 RepID=R1ECZ3_BOTPV|nr:hypothetical protein UCRNP2_7918 [Neofusicoccum parvum UCRNP2]